MKDILFRLKMIAVKEGDAVFLNRCRPTKMEWHDYLCGAFLSPEIIEAHIRPLYDIVASPYWPVEIGRRATQSVKFDLNRQAIIRQFRDTDWEITEAA